MAGKLLQKFYCSDVQLSKVQSVRRPDSHYITKSNFSSLLDTCTSGYRRFAASLKPLNCVVSAKT